MTTNNIGHQLSNIDQELDSIDAQIAELKNRRQKLLERKNQLERASKRRNSLLTDQQLSWEAETFPWSAKLKMILNEIFKLDNFREKQLSAMNAILANEDTIIIMSTGSGKSLCYQLPALLSDGFTLVISPLVSLMQDQIMALKRFGINGSMLSQSTDKADHTSVLNSMVDPTSDMKILLVTPEKLAKSKRFMSKLEKSYQMKRLQRIAIDEVHCCSQWGHDFRPDYKFLNILRRQFPENVPILGLTATATSTVIDDVKNILNIPAALTFRAPFNRPNLIYEVAEKPSRNEAVVKFVVALLLERFRNQTGIIYCFSKKETDELADALRRHDIKAECYHADLLPEQRMAVHENWYSGRCKVIVATIAFGMGIDKPNVRFVIHHSMSKSLENYYQESGRAGRDGENAVCLLLYAFNDIFRQSSMVCTERIGMQNLYGMVKFCLKSNQCRRIVLAEHFGETYAEDWCDKHCDVCSDSARDSHFGVEYDLAKKRFKKYISQIFADNKGNKMTGPKLAETLSKISKEPRSTCEIFIAEQLLLDILKQEFHFTPYAIICYVVAGTYWTEDDEIDGIINANEQCNAASRKRKIE